MGRKSYSSLAQLKEQATVNRGSAVQEARGSHFKKEKIMSVVKRLQSLKLSDDAMITLTYEEVIDVFVHNEMRLRTR